MQFRPWPSNDERKQPSSLQETDRQFRDNRYTRLPKLLNASSVTLNNDESQNHNIDYSGVLTVNTTVVVANIPWQWHVFNNTTGAFTLTIKTPSGTGIVVGQGKRAILACDGTNVVRVTADT